MLNLYQCQDQKKFIFSNSKVVPYLQTLGDSLYRIATIMQDVLVFLERDDACINWFKCSKFEKVNVWGINASLSTKECI